MARLSFFVICWLIFNTVSGQQIINNTLTPDHQNVKGTKISLIPPKGFEKATNFLGFQQPQSGSSIMISNIPGPFSKVSGGLTKEGFLTQGVEVREIEKFVLNGIPAVLLTGVQNAHGSVYTKFVLCLGTEEETMMINGASPENLQEIGKGIKASLLTSFYEPDKKVNLFDVIDFEVNVSATKMTFAKSMANSLIYTVDGLLPTELKDRTFFMIGKSFSKSQIEDRKLFCLNRVRQLANEVSQIDSAAEISIDGISGYEIIASAKSKGNGEEEKVYQVILFSDNLYYIMYGYTNNDFAGNVLVLRNIAKTFRRK